MAMSLNSIITAGLIMAFVLPALAIVSLTLPNPPMYNQTENLTAIFQGTGITLVQNFNSSAGALNNQLIAGNSHNSTNNTGSFYANPTIFNAFAFIVSGLGQIMVDIVQLPYLDYVSLNFITTGMQSVLGGTALGVLTLGIDLLYSYMVLSILFTGISMIMKYNVQASTTG